MKTETEPKQTAMQRLISELEDIKQTKCKTLQEVVFFDGVLAIIESKYLPEERKEIETAKLKQEIEIIKGKIDVLISLKLTRSFAGLFSEFFDDKIEQLEQLRDKLINELTKV